VGESDEGLLPLICRGLEWLADHQNVDGGWGDTDLSLSNVATTMSVIAAFQLTGVPANHVDLMSRAQAYVDREGGVPALRRRYGRDKSFVIPILTHCALAEQVSWREVTPLPFELAALPHSWYRFLRLPVVSFAIPALVAVGQARFFHRRPWNPFLRLLRKATVSCSLQVLERMQPASGGYLESVPLTSYILMSLASTGRKEHPLVARGVGFLASTVRPDGSWPIEVNLSTRNTTLAIQALCRDQRTDAEDVSSLDWLIQCQHQRQNPSTGAPSGGWGWSHLSGAIPDADNTSLAILALRNFHDTCGGDVAQRQRVADVALRGIYWLRGLQNSDGGWPTFSRGWDALPLDRSGTDLTAHALRAFRAWRDRANGPALDEAIGRAWEYLRREQQPDGAWQPLWFGNHWQAQESNPVYGTARVLLAYADYGYESAAEAQAGVRYLMSAQHPSGAWGGPPQLGKQSVKGPRTDTASVEETALAVEALIACGRSRETWASIERGVEWLVDAVRNDRHRRPSPIGLYFAKLYYHEQLYPLTFALSALSAASRVWVESEMHRPLPANIYS
jgi:squalene-hopene/tetraprenyl-beta-curcumene cyclase